MGLFVEHGANHVDPFAPKTVPQPAGKMTAIRPERSPFGANSEVENWHRPSPVPSNYSYPMD